METKNESDKKSENSQLKSEIIRLKVVMKTIQQQLEILEGHSLRNNIQNIQLIQNSNKMNKHIDFIESVYEKIKKPFHWLMSKIEELSGKYINGSGRNGNDSGLEMSGESGNVDNGNADNTEICQDYFDEDGGYPFNGPF